MTTFWDLGLHASTVRAAAERNGLEVKVRLGFVLELRRDQIALAEVYFDEVARDVARVEAKNDGIWTGWHEVCHPPYHLRSVATPRERLDNLVRWLDDGMPADFKWKARNLFAVTTPLDPETLAPVTPITIARKKTR